jgi:hypothetical protein
MSFNYSILSFIPSLENSATRIPLGVLVEGIVSKERLLVIVGADAPIEVVNELDTVSKKLLEKIPEILKKEIERSKNRDPQENILDYLFKNNRYNFNISFPKDIAKEEYCEVDYKMATNIPQNLSNIASKHFSEMVNIALSLFVINVLTDDIEKDLILKNFLETPSEPKNMYIKSPSIEIFKQPQLAF